MNSLVKTFPQTVLDEIENPFVIKNAHGVVLACNKAFQNLYRPGAAKIVGLTSYDFLPLKEAEIHVNADLALIAGTDSFVDYRITRDASDGNALQLDVHKSASFRADGTPEILAVLHTKTLPCSGAQYNYLLSPKEMGVLELLVQGHSQKRIAKILGISNFTVNDHLKAVYTKLGVTSRTQAQLKAIVELGMGNETG